MGDNGVPEWATEIAQFWMNYTTEIALTLLAVLAALYALKNYANGWKWKPAVHVEASRPPRLRRHSARNVTTGSTRAAVRAGCHVASRATATTANVTTA